MDKLHSWIKGCAAMLLVLNLLDLIATLLLVLPNLTWEMNPLMAMAIDASPVIFACVKTILIALSTWLLAYKAAIKYPIRTLLILLGGIGLYGVVCAGHLHALTTILTIVAHS